MNRTIPFRALAACVALWMNAVTLAAQEATSLATLDERLTELSTALPGWMEEAGVPGLAIAVVTRDRVWSEAFGIRDAAAGTPVTEETLFEAASLSKPVFAYAVLRLLEDGVLELHAPLSDDWAHPDLSDDERAHAITTAHVLSHRTGLPNWRRSEPLRTQFTPGARYGYSGEGYVYLQRALAARTGEDVSTLADRLVFGPLGMPRSRFVFETDARNHAVPHHSSGRALGKRPAPPPGNAAASLHTTAAEYGRFMQAVLREEGLEAGALTRIAEPLTDVAPELAWGLGWGLALRTGDGIPALWHWGDNGPFKAFTYLDPATGTGFVYFANSTNGLAIARRVTEHLAPGAHPIFEWLEYEQLGAER